MKKLIFTLLVIFATSFALTSCSEELIEPMSTETTNDGSQTEPPEQEEDPYAGN